MMRKGIIRSVLGVTMAALLGACASNGVYEAARRGAEMTVELEQEMRAVIKAQNKLHQQRLAIAVDAINDLYQNRQQYMIVQEAEAFAKANAQTAADPMRAKVVAYLDRSIKSWAKRHADYEKLVADAIAKFEKADEKVELDRAKLKALRAKFLALSSPRTRQDTLKLLVAFAADVKADLNRRSQDLKEAGSSAATASTN